MGFPLLTDEQIETIQMIPECWSHGGLYGMFIRDKFARAVESATRAPLLAEIERLTAELAAARKALALVQQHHATAWNRGHTMGMAANRDIARQAQAAVARDAWGNTQLTEALLAAEAERDEARAELAAAREDAERYRWLAAHARSVGEHWGGRWSLVIDGPAPTRDDCEDALDAAIDAARGQKDQADTQRGA